MMTQYKSYQSQGKQPLRPRILRNGLGLGLMLLATPALASPADSLSTDTTTYNLDDVTITVQRKLVKNDIDKLTYDVAHDETAQTKNTLDMLRSVPLVSIDGQENITVKGSKSFKVYRNGHPDPTLSSQNLKDVLKAIPASQIKKVEVITDPGAKEDAEGTQYILNIVMKENAGLSGVTGNVYSSYNFLTKTPGIGGMLTMQKGKFATSINYGFTHQRQEQGNYNETYFVKSGNTLVDQNRNEVAVNVHYGNLSTSYEIDSLNLATLSFGGYYYGAGIDDYPTPHRMTDSNGNPVYSYTGIVSIPTYNAYALGGRMDFQHKTHKEGEVLTVSYQLQMTRSHQNINERYTDYINLPVSYTGMNNNNRARFMEHTFQLDYIRPLGKLFKWNAGAKYILRSNKSDVTLTYTGAEEMNQHSLFDHNTQVAAAYTEWMYSGEKVQARAGLRYEHSYLKAEFPDGAQAGFSKRLNDWVPSASVRYAMSDAHAVKFSFATTINRPGIDYLNPARTSTPSSLSYGNPALNSSRNYSLRLEYNYTTTSITFWAGVSHTFCNDQISALQFDQDGISVSTYGDLLHYRTWMLWAYVQASLWKGANISGGPNVFRVVFKDGGVGLEHSRWSSWNTINFTQKLPWKLTLGMNGGFRIGREAESVYSYSAPSHYWNASLSRTFLKDDRLSANVSVANLFGPHLRSYRSYVFQGDFRGVNSWMGHQKGVYVTLSWRFGKLKGGVKNVDRTIENDDLVGGISTGNGKK